MTHPRPAITLKYNRITYRLPLLKCDKRVDSIIDSMSLRRAPLIRPDAHRAVDRSKGHLDRVLRIGLLKCHTKTTISCPAADGGNTQPPNSKVSRSQRIDNKELPEDIVKHIILMSAVSGTDFMRICEADKTLAEYCDSTGFWKEVLQIRQRLREWPFQGVPEAEREYKKWFVMLSRLEEPYYVNDLIRLLGFDNTTSVIEEFSFFQCDILNLDMLPPKVTTIEEHAFEDCVSLELNKGLPVDLKTIGISAFAGCQSLKLHDGLPKGLENINDETFSGCTSLVINHLPESILKIGEKAFFSCPELMLDGLPGGLHIIGDSAFYGCKKVVIKHLPASIETIGDSAFYGCENLMLKRLPEGLHTIGDSAFYGCEKVYAKKALRAQILAINRKAFVPKIST